MNNNIFELDFNENHNKNIIINNIEFKELKFNDEYYKYKKQFYFDQHITYYKLFNENNNNISFLLNNVNSIFNIINYENICMSQYFINNFKYINNNNNKINILFHNNIINLNLNYNNKCDKILSNHDIGFINLNDNVIHINFKYLTVIDENNNIINNISNNDDLKYLLNSNYRFDLQIEILLIYDNTCLADPMYQYYFIVKKIKVYNNELFMLKKQNKILMDENFKLRNKIDKLKNNKNYKSNNDNDSNYESDNENINIIDKEFKIKIKDNK